MTVFKGLSKIFKVNDRENIAIIRRNSNLPHIGAVNEQHRLNFFNKLLDNNYLSFYSLILFFL